MNRLILDYFRRKWWILSIGALAELILGWCSGYADRNGHDTLAAFQVQIGLFTGIFLLSFDLQRGAARSVTFLPLTIKQIARAWWLAAVGIPALVFSAWMFLGAAAFCLMNSDVNYDWPRLAVGALSLFLWMGTSFTILMNSTSWTMGSGWQRLVGMLSGAVWGVMIGGGFLFLQNFRQTQIKFLCFLITGFVLTLGGWIGAEFLMRGRVNFKLATNAGSAKFRSLPVHQAGGYGGIPLLLSTTFVRAFLMGVAMLLFLPLIMLVQGQLKSWSQAVELLSSAGIFPFWFVIFFSLVPMLTQLRFLRSLPISANRLAAVMMALVVLPLLALGALATGLAMLCLPTATALGVAKAYALTLAPATLSIAFACLQGVGMLSYLVLILTMVSAQFIPIGFQYFYRGEMPLGVAGLISLAFVLISFLMTRQALARSSRAYRPQANPFGNAWGWGASR